ncbi:TonB-dependent siderophore receptor [Cephaloticoccus capnophilus]|nr:TonB-dependent receptor [Cephaloticoccus capnophilus]
MNIPTSIRRVLRDVFASSLMLGLAVSSHAQQPPIQIDEDIIRLSPFTVQESANLGRYQAAQVSSGSRVRMDLMDSTQSVSVLTNEFLGDIDTTQMLDAVKYVAGVGISNNPEIMDIMNIRGFQNWRAVTIDGFSQAYGVINTDPIIIERIEVVKGPNAILAPQGLPGGVVNSVTKRPLFKNSGSVSYQVGRYDSNRAEIDANYVVKDDKLALRVVGAFTDADKYVKEKFFQNLTVIPMLTYRISPTTELTAQGHVYNGAAQGEPLPISVYAVGRSNVRILDGIPRDFGLTGRNISRHESGQRAQFFLTSQITDKLSMRLAAKWAETSTRVNGVNVSESRDASGARLVPVQLNNTTGVWEWDGVTRNDDPRFLLSGLQNGVTVDHANLQNDFVFEHNAQGWRSQTVGGYAINYTSRSGWNRNYVADPTLYNFKDPNYTPPTFTLESDWDYNNGTRDRSHQVYLYQVLHLFEDRLVLSGSLSQNRYFTGDYDNLSGGRSQEKAETTLPAAGLVYKLTPEISLYYGYSEQEIMGASQPVELIPSHTSPSRQHEVGLRLRLFDGRLYTTFAYFDIMQDGIWSQATENMIDPTAPKKTAQRSDRTSKGFEFEFAWSPTKNFSVIGSFTDFKSRDQDDLRYANVAERMAGIWGSYSFPEAGPLRGLSIGLGANYVGERPGDTMGSYVNILNPVRVQPAFWLPSYTEVEANATYRFNKHWKAQLVIKNLLDKEYIRGAFNRNAFVSTPINPKLTIRYQF